MNKKFLDLGYQPLANKYLRVYKKLTVKSNELYRLAVGFDNKTKLVSLINKIPDKKMFDGSYPYKSSMSKTMINSFKKLSLKIKKRFKPKLAICLYHSTADFFEIPILINKINDKYLFNLGVYDPQGVDTYIHAHIEEVTD